MIHRSFAPKFAFWFAWWIAIAIVGIRTQSEMPPWVKAILITIGVFLLIYGLILNAIAGKSLKIYGHFEMAKGIKNPDRIVTEGIYGCMRHPAQFGSIMFGIGISLITTSIYAILLAGWYAFTAVYFILAIEERETLERFGEEYCEFLKSRKPFSLSPRCLARGIRAIRNKGEYPDPSSNA